MKARKQFAKERKEHPTMTAKQVWQIVRDHARQARDEDSYFSSSRWAKIHKPRKKRFSTLQQCPRCSYRFSKYGEYCPRCGAVIV
jgi:hypothetical protein